MYAIAPTLSKISKGPIRRGINFSLFQNMNILFVGRDFQEHIVTH
jgi:hypothetical protein